MPLQLTTREFPDRIERDVEGGQDRLLSIVIDNIDSKTRFPAVGQRAEGTLTWPVNHSAHVRQLIDSAIPLFAAYGRQGYPVTAEIILNGNQSTGTLPAGTLANATFQFLTDHRIGRNDRLELLLLAAGDLAVEWDFDYLVVPALGASPQEIPVQCSLMCTLVVAAPMSTFFCAHHAIQYNLLERAKELFTRTLSAFAPMQLVP